MNHILDRKTSETSQGTHRKIFAVWTLFFKVQPDKRLVQNDKQKS